MHYGLLLSVSNAKCVIRTDPMVFFLRIIVSVVIVFEMHEVTASVALRDALISQVISRGCRVTERISLTNHVTHIVKLKSPTVARFEAEKSDQRCGISLNFISSSTLGVQFNLCHGLFQNESFYTWWLFSI